MQHPHKIISLLLTVATLVTTSPLALGQEAIVVAPYEQTFIISAYYSPKPNQVVYFRGSFEADRRLNGNGTHGADGTPVYVGMLAGPKSYAFGTRLEIPGLGVGAIHDRGGAIVDAGVRSNAYDRIDVWMGDGEAGLARALTWGMRTVKAKVYPPGYAIAEHFDLPGSQPTFVADLRIGDANDAVTRLQKELKTFGYYRADINGTYDDATKEAVLKYQFARRVVLSANDANAGVFAGVTRATLNNELFRKTWTPPASLLAASVLKAGASTTTKKTTATATATNSRFPVSLSSGDSGERVRQLQLALFRLGNCDHEANGSYDDATAACVVNFQIAHDIVKADTEFGAGVFGDKTRATLTTALDTLDGELNKIIANKLPNDTAAPGDSGEVVKRLQEGLTTLGLYDSGVSGRYDDVTRAAIVKFQTDAKILASASEYGAGFFGAKTKSVFVDRLRAALIATPVETENPTWNRPTTVAYTPTFDATLSLGDTGERVSELQKTLAKLGFYTSEPTGTYDDATRAAVVKFQLDAAVVKSATDYGAGTLGPKTRTALNAAIAREKVALTRVKNQA